MFDSLLLPLAGTAVIIGLLGYLAWLLWQLRAQQRRQAAATEQLAISNQEQHEHRRKSMEMIALATIDGDCELSEACIRVKHLLDYYPGLAADPVYRVIGEMYAEIRQFATHEARAALTLKARAAEDRARYQIEQRFGNDFMACMRALHRQMLELEGSRFDMEAALGPRVTSSGAAA
ncbi:MAG: DUF2489 domain-containing protein [Gammaproteobacteria bacterium]|nr:DUF2489 domain-containing protein [Gammaproteobacteria bacterium]